MLSKSNACRGQSICIQNYELKAIKGNHKITNKRLKSYKKNLTPAITHKQYCDSKDDLSFKIC